MVRYHQVTEREGEWQGPIDWAHEHIVEMEVSPYRARLAATLREHETDHERLWVSTYGGELLVGCRQVVAIGMWDGWPYWRPTPTVAVIGPLGRVEYYHFNELTRVEVRDQK